MGVKLPPNFAYKTLDVEYRCFAPGQVVITVEIPFPNNNYAPAIFTWKKMCGGSPPTHLNIVTSFDEQVVSAGVVSPEWAAVTGDHKVFPSDVETTFRLSKSRGARQVIPTPSHLFDRISPISSPLFPVFCAFSPSRRGGSNEPKTGIQGQESVSGGPNTVSPVGLTPGVGNAWPDHSLRHALCHGRHDLRHGRGLQSGVGWERAEGGDDPGGGQARARRDPGRSNY
eukprot:COSAG04_NODE_559_length_12608_cov_12.306499_3_plen_227_part_00